MPACDLTDRLQHNGLEDFRAVYCQHRAPNAVPPIMGLELCLTPLITGGKKVDDLVNFADTIVGCKSGAIERHGFLPSTRASPFGSLWPSNSSDNFWSACIVLSAAAVFKQSCKCPEHQRIKT